MFSYLTEVWKRLVVIFYSEKTIRSISTAAAEEGQVPNLTNRWNAAARKKGSSDDVTSSRRDSDQR